MLTPAQKAAVTGHVKGKAAFNGLSHEEIAAKLRSDVGEVDRQELTNGMLAASLVKAELVALSAGDKAYLQTIMLAASMPLTATLKKELGDLFPAGSKTRTNVVALLRQQTTLAAELGVPGITTSDVADALREGV